MSQVPYNDYENGDWGAFYIIAIGSNGSRAISPIYDFRGLYYNFYIWGSGNQKNLQIQISTKSYNLGSKDSGKELLKSLRELKMAFKFKNVYKNCTFTINSLSTGFDCQEIKNMDFALSDITDQPEEIYAYSNSGLKYKIKQKQA